MQCFSIREMIATVSHDDCRQVMERVLKGDYSFPSSMRVSDSCKDLLQKILTVDPALRITIEGIQQHPW